MSPNLPASPCKCGCGRFTIERDCIAIGYVRQVGAYWVAVRYPFPGVAVTAGRHESADAAIAELIPACVPYVKHDPANSHGYPFRPACECGWFGPVRYAAEHAALAIATEHATPRN